MTALIRSSDLKKIKPIMFSEEINTKVFRRSIALAIALVVTSHSSSFEHTVSVHAVHACAKRNVCNIVVSIHFRYCFVGRQYLILTSVAQKAELKVVGVLEVRARSGAEVSVLVCTRGSAIEMDWWWFGVLQ